jgi:hypothetical protein
VKAVPPSAGWIPAFAGMIKMGPKRLFTNPSNIPIDANKIYQELRFDATLKFKRLFLRGDSC